MLKDQAGTFTLKEELFNLSSTLSFNGAQREPCKSADNSDKSACGFGKNYVK